MLPGVGCPEEDNSVNHCTVGRPAMVFAINHVLNVNVPNLNTADPSGRAV